ncbi:O-antigen ligase family protein [Horticoccus sp. 23ND18S-11]|uniref:O-antigen ligase family protein n=1 Tax=Horticoccus sp. 23ND18S-11 TaxID=3391832 RepID=UPI0039C9A1C2
MLRPADPVSAARVQADPGARAVSFLIRVGLIIAVAALATVTCWEPSASRQHTWPLAVVVACMWWLAPVVFLHGVRYCSQWRLPPKLIVAGATILALGTVVSAQASPFGALSEARIWPTLSGVILLLTLHHLWSPGSRSNPSLLHRPARWLGLAGAGFVLASLALWLRATWPLPWGTRNGAPFGHSTYTAGAVVLFLPWIVLQAWFARGRPRVLWLIVSGLALLVLASTSSRGGVLAVASTGLVAACLAVSLGPWSTRRKLLLGVGALALGAVAVFSNPRLRELVLQREWSEGARESNRQRQAMLEAGWKLGLARPLLGWGPGSVPLAYPRVRAQLEGGTENILQLHNTPAQVWATTGAVGAVAMLLLVSGTLLAMARAPRTPVSGAAAAALLGFGIVALTDHQLDLPLMNTVVVLSLALLTAPAPDRLLPISPRTRDRIALGCLPTFAAIGVANATFGDLDARHVHEEALMELGTGQPDKYLELLDLSARLAPLDVFFQHQAAFTVLEQRARLPDAAGQRALTQTAATRLKRSLATGVHTEYAHFNLGWLLLDLNEPAAAAEHFIAAAHVVPDKGGVYFGLGLALQAGGRLDDAVRAFALEIVNDPRHATSPAWEIPHLAVLLPAVRAEALRRLGELSRERPDAARLEAWLRWWWVDPAAAPSPPGFNRESSGFLAALPAVTARTPLPVAVAGTAWGRAYADWLATGTGGTPPDTFLATAGGDRAFADALLRRARRHQDSFRAFLTAPTEDEAALTLTYRRQRPGYGMLTSHPEGPVLADAYIVQENRLVTALAAGLFPAKGWLPGRFLLALLPAHPR